MRTLVWAEEQTSLLLGATEVLHHAVVYTKYEVHQLYPSTLHYFVRSPQPGWTYSTKYISEDGERASSPSTGRVLVAFIDQLIEWPGQMLGRCALMLIHY